MANDLAPQLMQTIVSFFGHDCRAKEDMSATEFLRRQTDTMAARNQAAPDNEKITATTANFRAEASTWWNLSLPNQVGPAEMHRLRTDWEAFVQRFKKEYFPFVHRSDQNLNWVGLKQLPHESAYGFLQRVFNAATAFSDTNLMPTDTAVPVAFAMPAAAAGDGDAAAVIAALDGLNAARKLVLSKAITEAKLACMREVSKRYTTCVANKVVLNGLRDLRLRSTLQKAATEDVDIVTMLEQLRLAETNLPLRAFQPGKGGGAAGVHAVEKAEPGSVDKVDAKKKKKPKKARKPPKGDDQPSESQTRTRDDSLSCDYCHRRGHSEDQCFSKRKASDRQKEFRKQDASGSGMAATADNADEAADDQLQQALNSIRT